MRVHRLLARRDSLCIQVVALLLVVASLTLLTQTAWPLLAGALLLGLILRARRLRREAAEDAADAVRPVQPAGVDDMFCSCPHCGLLGSHHILSINGSYATRACLFCSEQWTFDHADATRPRSVLGGAAARERIRACRGCAQAAVNAVAKPGEWVECGTCGRTVCIPPTAP